MLFRWFKVHYQFTLFQRAGQNWCSDAQSGEIVNSLGFRLRSLNDPHPWKPSFLLAWWISRQSTVLKGFCKPSFSPFLYLILSELHHWSHVLHNILLKTFYSKHSLYSLSETSPLSDEASTDLAPISTWKPFRSLCLWLIERAWSLQRSHEKTCWHFLCYGQCSRRIKRNVGQHIWTPSDPQGL